MRQKMTWVNQIKLDANVLVFLALSGAALAGLLAAQNRNALIVLVALALFVVVLFSRRASNWVWALLLIGVGVSLGRLNIEFGPSPLNTWRLQQIGLIALTTIGLSFYLIRLKSSSGRATVPPKSILLGTLAYLVSYMGNAVVHWDYIQNWPYFRGSMESALFAPLVFFIAFLLYRSDKHAIQFLWACYLIGVLQALLAFAQIFFPADFYRITEALSPSEALRLNYFTVYRRVNGVWRHAPALGAMMAIILAAGAYLIWQTRGVKKWLVILGYALIGVALLATAAITPIVGGLASLLALFVLRSRERILQRVVGFAGIASILILVAFALAFIFEIPLWRLPFLDRVFASEGGVFGVSGSYASRLILYKEALRLWGNNFWWGVGAGQFRDFQRSVYDLTAHSVYLQTVSEMGVVGAFGLLTLIASVVAMDLRVWAKMNATERNLYAPIMLIAAVLLAVSIFDFAFYSWNFQLLFWFSQGLVAAKFSILAQYERVSF